MSRDLFSKAVSDDEFDANERIAGFSMVAIKRALTSVGMLDDRDDVENVSSALKCPAPQAKRVLEELERRELVVKAKKRNQWEATPKGNRLAFHWHPPRKFTPAIDREFESKAINEGFESVPCSIWRSSPDDEDMFEEAQLEVGLWVEYDGDRLIEINVTQEDEYQGESAGSGQIESSVYISADDAKRFVVGLQQAIAKAEAEAAWRARQRARKEKRLAVKRLKAAEAANVARTERDAVAGSAPIREQPSPPPRSKVPKHHDDGRTATTTTNARSHVPAAPTPSEAENEAEARQRSRRAISASLKELREKNRARRAAPSGTGPVRKK